MRGNLAVSLGVVPRSKYLQSCLPLDFEQALKGTLEGALALVFKGTVKRVFGNKRERRGRADADAGRAGGGARAEVAFLGRLALCAIPGNFGAFDDFHRAKRAGNHAVFTADTLLSVDKDDAALDTYRV
jgi:hypothetical protein